MWTQIGVLSEDEVFNDTFSVNTLVQIDHTDPNTVSFIVYCACKYIYVHYKISIAQIPKQIQHDPNLRATFRNENVVVAIDNVMHLLEKDLIGGKSQNTKVISFPIHIDCLTISPDGQLIICGLSDGNIVGMRTASLNSPPVFNM